jgi:hypothetical protein
LSSNNQQKKIIGSRVTVSFTHNLCVY